MGKLFTRFRSYILATGIVLGAILFVSFAHWVIITFSIPYVVIRGVLLIIPLLFLIFCVAQIIEEI